MAQYLQILTGPTRRTGPTGPTGPTGFLAVLDHSAREKLTDIADGSVIGNFENFAISANQVYPH